ncbi:hypothetical protein C2S53_003640 [Perilla frutescens var. hirtella]|uniref:Uncharacterized protein n=1 Tax=Perilla frutescens var. hirtella TaxID=608512 RepID=A0AAD4JLF2_PERFH|nr:hypothetical protein C2S53_003640 [Perilla frutescens var. hirtella]
MADIAILIAEEHERRVRNSKKSELVSCVGVRMEDLRGSSSWMREKMRMQREKVVELLDKGLLQLQPKSQITLAASSALFSA